MDNVKYKIVDNIIYTSDVSNPLDSKGVGHFYYNQMVKNKNKIAQIDGFTKEEDTFGCLLERAVRTALTMTENGIKPGDHVSLCSDIHLNTPVPYLASFFIGAIMGPIDPLLSVEESVTLLQQTLPKMIFVIPSAVGLIEQVIQRIGTKSKIVVFGETVNHTPFLQFICPHKREIDFKPKEVENLKEIATIVLSSGSSGVPKPICYSHQNILSFVVATPVTYCNLYSIAKPYWSVFTTFIHLSITGSYTRVIYPSFNPDTLWTMFYQNIDLAFLNPLQALQMVRSTKPAQADLKNVQVLYLTGNPITVKQLKEIKLALPYTSIYFSYGQSEVFTGILSFPFTPSGKELVNKHLGSVGTIMQGCSYKVVDIETEKVLGPNQIGELRIKSAATFIGYYNHDSSDCFDSDGWLKTGDLFYYDEDLCFYIVDRVKEAFKFLNFFISPREIENVILNLEPIEAAVVIGVPNETDCNHPMAVVKLKPNARQISAEEIVKYVDERLEDKKRLRAGVKFVRELPFTISGKISRFKLRKMILGNDIEFL